MNVSNAALPDVKLHAGEAVSAQIKALSEVDYQLVREALKFAEVNVALQLRRANAKLDFYIPYYGVDLRVAFCRQTERFMVVWFEIKEDDPEPPPGTDMPSDVFVDRLLHAIGETRLPNLTPLILAPVAPSRPQLGDETTLDLLSAMLVDERVFASEHVLPGFGSVFCEAEVTAVRGSRATWSLLAASDDMDVALCFGFGAPAAPSNR